MYGRNVWLIDMWGTIVHRWEAENLPGNYGQLLPNGRLLYAGRTLPPAIPEFAGNGGQLAEYDWNGKIVWETVRDGKRARYQDEPDTGFRRRFVANLLKLLPIDSQL